jgi:hypothetical protein
MASKKYNEFTYPQALFAPHEVTTANVLHVPNGQRFGSDFYYYFQT